MLPGARDRPALAGDVAIVTGAGSGVGAATARELARRGATVVLAARRMNDLQVHARAIRAAGGEAMAIPTDVADANAVELLAERTLATLGRVDVLVNSCDAWWLATLESSSAEEIVRLVEVNLISLILLTRAVLPGMLHRHHGAIISVESLSRPVPLEPVHAATKWGIRGFSLSLRGQVTGTGVSVSSVSLGKIDTPSTTQARVRVPGADVVAATIADLVTEPHREVEIHRSRYVLASAEEIPPPTDLAQRRRHHGVPQDQGGATWKS
jgi:NADP-dependent 3-hydroxy acid dehydrogenase YdfG